MEALKMKLIVAIVAMLMAISAFQNVAAVDAPAPSPTSDAVSSFIPIALGSFVALAFGMLV